MSNVIPAKEYCKSIFDGTHETPKPTTIGHPLVTSKHIMNKNLDLSTTYNIASEDFKSIQKRSVVSQWDILFSMIGSVGDVYLEKSSSIPYAIKNLGVFSCKDEYRAKWLYYYFQSPEAQKHIKRYLNGAVQKFLPLGALRDFPVKPFNENSSGIINVLSALDAKIALNNRINAELESMAKTLYDYWFVQFDFPDKNGKPYKSSGGKMVWNEELKREIPEGWIVNKLGDILDISLGGTPSTDNKSFWENGIINWLNSGEVADFPVVTSELKITQKAIHSSATELLPKGTVLLSITRHIRPTILAIDACANQSVVGIKEKDNIKSNYIYPYIKNEVPRYLSLRTGAQQPHINKETVEESLIITPSKESTLLTKYNKVTEPIYTLIINNALQNQQLSTLRDFLLPMLMNGQVKVN